MRVIKPYGQTVSETTDLETLRRLKTLPRSAAPDGTMPPEDLRAFATTWPEVVIAQWISTIDKIATKPVGDKGATEAQIALRDALGSACWARLTTEGGSLADLAPERLSHLGKHWSRKLHPYRGKRLRPHKGAKLPNPRGRWFARFCGDAELGGIDAPAVARQIEEHLTEDAYRRNGGTQRAPETGGARGLMERRAVSIENNVLKPISASALTENRAVWTDADRAAYVAPGDPATAIRAEASAAERKERRVSHRLAAEVLFRHFARVFVKDGAVLSGKDAETAMPGLFALHRAVRDTYTRLLKRHAKKTIAAVLPADIDRLLLLIDRQATNRDVNALVRLGRVIHHQAGVGAGTGDTTAAVVDHWPDPGTVEASRYWSTPGQIEIKRTEAFVRAWRAPLAFAARTLNDWIDPDRLGGVAEGKGFDILLNADFKAALARMPAGAAMQKGRLLFGTRAAALGIEDAGTLRDLLRLVFRTTAQLRHATFHFRGMAGFVETLKVAGDIEVGASWGDNIPATGMARSPALEGAKALWNSDQADRLNRVRDTLRATHAEYFFDQGRLERLWGYLAPSAAALALPRFNRVVERAENAWKREAKLCLPPLPSQDDLERQPARRCQYVVLKELYEGAFRDWLAERSADEINGWIDRAGAHTTDEAKALMRMRLSAEQRRNRPETLNQDDIDLAEARASGLIALEEGQGFGQFLAALSGLTASEFRVQEGYTHNRAEAREQSAFLDNLHCDLVALAFDQWLRQESLAWLYRMDWTASPDRPQGTLEVLHARDRASPVEDWQAALYLVMHLIPADDVGALLHRLRWWSNGLTALPAAGTALQEVFTLYLDMHDAKFSGGDALRDDARLSRLFESAELRDRLLPGLLDPEESETGRVPKRGLREMLRFGDAVTLGAVLERYPVTQKQLDEWSSLEQRIATAQKTRTHLHKSYMKGVRLDREDDTKNARIEADLIDYCDALRTIVRHRQLSHQIGLVNHVRLHRIVMRVLGRLVDFAGLWERDLYFVTLALMHLDGKTPADVFKAKGVQALQTGQIVRAVTGEVRNDAGQKKWLDDGLTRYFGGEVFRPDPSAPGGSRGAEPAKNIRNRLSHLNMLGDAAKAVVDPQGAKGRALNLTEEVASTRQMMAYDRKLKNVVTKAVIGALEREKIALSWRFQGHDPSGAVVKAGQATHLKCRELVEDLHDPAFLGMVAAAFGGKVETNQRVSIERRPAKQVAADIIARLEGRHRPPLKGRRDRDDRPPRQQGDSRQERA